MIEPPQLVAARTHLFRAESAWRKEDGLAHLEEGLALLEQVAIEAAPRHRQTAANLLATYSRRICGSVRTLVETDRGLPEPELEHLFRILLAFDAAVELDLPDYVRLLKIEVAKRLIELYYEGHPDEEKGAALRRLAGIAERTG